MTSIILIVILAMTAAALLALEAWALMTGRQLITTIIREWNRKTGGFVALLFGLIAGLLGGHMFWCG